MAFCFPLAAADSNPIVQPKQGLRQDAGWTLNASPIRAQSAPQSAPNVLTRRGTIKPDLT